MKLEAIRLVNGVVIPIGASVTAVVGPNNAGKSTFLREIQQALAIQHGQMITPPKLVAGYSLVADSHPGELVTRISGTYPTREPGQYQDGLWSERSWRLTNGATLLESQIHQYWNSNSGLGPLAQYFSILLDANNRLHMATSTSSYDTLREPPTNPVQRLFADRVLEETLSALTRKAFDKSLTVNRYSGGQIHLHIGAPSEAEGIPPQSDAYLEQLAQLPRIDEQGDGFRAFVGMVLSVLAGAYPVVLLDEPEAFLHPPQARLLGQFLAGQHTNGTQVIVSTHSEDIIAGLTSVQGQGTSIVRLTRNEDETLIAQLAEDAVQALYEDPLIRYYDMLNGLFVRGVVLCEADSDCTYYRAVIEYLDSNEGIDSGLHFSHTGGKARIHVALQAFQRTKVPCAVLLDIDFLQNDVDFERVLKAAGADLSRYERDRKVVMAAVNDQTRHQSVTAARAEITEILKDATGQVTSSLIGKVSSAINGRSGWKEFKKYGKKMLQGDILTAYENLDANLKTAGIFLVPVGELEGFQPEFPATNKAQWLRAVLEDRSYENATTAQEYLREVRAYVASHQTA
jgi:hypothetical protein